MGNGGSRSAAGTARKALGGAGAKNASSRAKKAAAETADQKAARLQAEQGLPHEVTRENAPRDAQGDIALTPAHPGERVRYDPFAALNPHTLVQFYGEHQLGAALDGFSHVKLVGAARAAGMQGSLPRSNDALVSAIVAHTTAGRYSYHLEQTGAAPKTSRGAKAATPEEQAAKAQRAASRAAKVEAKAAQQRANDAAAAAIAARSISSSEQERWQGGRFAGPGFNPFGKPNPYYTARVYGAEHVETMLKGFSLNYLRQAADTVNRRNGWDATSKNYVKGTAATLPARIAKAVQEHPSEPFFANDLYT